MDTKTPLKNLDAMSYEIPPIWCQTTPPGNTDWRGGGSFAETKELKQNRSLAFLSFFPFEKPTNFKLPKCGENEMRLINAHRSLGESEELSRGGGGERSTTVINRRAASHFHTVAMWGNFGCSRQPNTSPSRVGRCHHHCTYYNNI